MPTNSSWISGIFFGGKKKDGPAQSATSEDAPPTNASSHEVTVAATDQRPTLSSAHRVHFQQESSPQKDYKAFLFVVHDQHGLMLLYCNRKKNKPPHYQLPGGHVDLADFEEAAAFADAPAQQLDLACKVGASRELFEETGIDVRTQLHRLQPAVLRTEVIDNDEPLMMIHELKGRLFYTLSVTDQDFPKGATASPMIGSEGQNLTLRLSHEHAGFLFQPNPEDAVKMLQHHSGGKCSQALLMSMTRHNKDVHAKAPETKLCFCL